MSCETATGTAAVAKPGHPLVWLVVPTLALLVGQAVPRSRWLSRFRLFFSRSFRCCWLSKQQRDVEGLLIFAASLAFSVGYIRHWQLLHPHFPPNHVQLLVTIVHATIWKDSSRENRRNCRTAAVGCCDAKNLVSHRS